MKSEDMYRQHIMELYKFPRNFGQMDNPTHSYTESSPSCGDEIEIQLKIKNEKIEDAKFYGSGCVISVVSSSLLTDKLKGMKISQLKKLNSDYIIKLLGLKLSSGRLNCALVPLKASQKAILKSK